jgi:hypothetical protein
MHHFNNQQTKIKGQQQNYIHTSITCIVKHQLRFVASVMVYNQQIISTYLVDSFMLTTNSHRSYCYYSLLLFYCDSTLSIDLLRLDASILTPSSDKW